MQEKQLATTSRDSELAKKGFYFTSIFTILSFIISALALLTNLLAFWMDYMR